MLFGWRALLLCMRFISGWLLHLHSPSILLQGDNAALITEIDNTSEAYEAMQSSNTGLVRQLGERDARISHMTGEQLRHDQAIARCKADRELSELASRTAQQHKQALEQRAHELQVNLQVTIADTTMPGRQGCCCLNL